jgi:hypothetical protein
MYSVLASCRSAKINPEMYLKDLLTRLPDMTTEEPKKYTPAAWASRHPEARITPPK